MPASALRERTHLRLDGRVGPVIIAHGGGNNAAALEKALASRADYLEIDLWVHEGRFEARHERRFPGPLPLIFERWYLRYAPRRPFDLGELLAATVEGTGVFLDLKNGGEIAHGLIRTALAGAARRGRVAASSQSWETLRKLGDAVPEVSLYYSIDAPAKLDLFLSVVERDAHPSGVSCRHTLLDGAIVKLLQQRGMAVVAWTVDEIDRAVELARMGVDGITTHRVAEVRAALALR